MGAVPPTLTDARVAIVSGKGGVGKTTVAAALGVAAAREGKRVLLIEIEGGDALAPLFGADRFGYEERTLAPNLSGLAANPDEALVEYLRVQFGIPKLSRALVRSKVVEFATNTAPGLRDILLIGKVWEAERARRDGRPAYDLIVVDAPPSGRLPRFLDAPRSISELVRAGPIQKHSRIVLDMVVDPHRLQVVLVTLAEEMPVRETSEAIEAIEKIGVAVGPVLVNGLWPELRGLGRDPAATLQARATEAGLALPVASVEALAGVASAHARRARNQRAALRELSSGPPRIELPFLFTRRLARAEIDTLATVIAGSGVL